MGELVFAAVKGAIALEGTRCTPHVSLSLAGQFFSSRLFG
jgi:hypothetical protein